MVARNFGLTILALVLGLAWNVKPATHADIFLIPNTMHVAVAADHGTQVLTLTVREAPVLSMIYLDLEVIVSTNPLVTIPLTLPLTSDMFGTAVIYVPLPTAVSIGEFYARVSAKALDPLSGQVRSSTNVVHFASKYLSNVGVLQTERPEIYSAIFGTAATAPSGGIALSSSSYAFVADSPGAMSGYVISASPYLPALLLPSGPAGVLGTN